MLRTLFVTGTVLALSVVATPARADHDRELGFIIGGALLGAAIAHHTSDHRRHSHHYVSTRHYHPVPVYYPRTRVRYVSPRYYGRHYGSRYGVGHYRYVHHH